ncbi:cytochrome c [Pseudooceanicola spongiae]|uniref:Cytochrome c domain-containing protein n=1 Tax=Pseudooceanicola spongiae TaxID=2613965 RepID=A0A7L9WJE6_9RHOB|nr:cytochrome c [Pseudooceanicola spongiae]QOL80511.1 hypothetical protein F3W81_06620 [Pseudooceanicola spongiae]
MTTPTTLGPVAIPCTACTNSTGADMQAAYAYCMTGVATVNLPVGTTALPFPFNIRASMIGGNRGAGLVKGAAHCATCHTARAVLIRAMGGPQVGVWYATNIPSAPEAGIGSGFRDEIVADLTTGRTEGKAGGSMAEAVEHSFSRMMQDLRAMATYPHVFMPPFGTQENAFNLPSDAEIATQTATASEAFGSRSFDVQASDPEPADASEGADGPWLRPCGGAADDPKAASADRLIAGQDSGVRRAGVEPASLWQLCK